MSRLPPQLQPLWPVVKRGHRWGARVLGAAGRRTVGPAHGLPRTGSERSRDTALLEPATTRIVPVGEAFTVRRTLPVGEPPAHWYFADRLEQRVPERFLLELTEGRLQGRHAAVVTAGGVLDLETSHYFDIAGWREHPVFWNPRPRPAERVDGTVAVLAARGTGHNYYHFLIDALPRLGMLDAAHPGLRPDRWVVDTATRYQRELIAMLGLEEDRLVAPGPGFSLQARRLLVPSLPNVSTLVSPETSAWLRDRLPPRAAASGLPERVYVTRGTTPNTRRMVHEQAVVALLRRRGFAVVDPGTLSVQEQIDHFAAARVVVAPHGAALTNLVFARDGVRVLELFAPTYLNGGYWSIVGNIPESRYRYVVADGPRATRPGRPQRGVMDDIDLAPARVEQALERLLAD
ncbi:glycosyltransferase family 61 protein [Nocardioides sp. LHD-245]|uniref:glycosyltransferase family 61 protein n=1 Tax=Nocardioides sp. LHD-245 TaxID=3051387 RepID=UPI0027E0EB1C|nr:glycosyltransferase family 61 protein [Nocardioides sp. LHD-245]